MSVFKERLTVVVLGGSKLTVPLFEAEKLGEDVAVAVTELLFDRVGVIDWVTVLVLVFDFGVDIDLDIEPPVTLGE